MSTDTEAEAANIIQLPEPYPCECSEPYLMLGNTRIDANAFPITAAALKALWEESETKAG